MPVLVIGHRGCAHVPENTLQAFDRAIALGARMIEFDVRERLVVSHDPTRQTRPTLADALRFLKSKDVFINVELKVDGLVRETLRLLRKHDLIERTVVSSFLHDQVALAKRRCPELAGGVLSQDRLMDPARYVREIVGADVYGPGRAVYQAVRGVGVHVWTVNDPKEMKRLIAEGATGIFTDYPERLARLAPPRSRG
ncbi:MAG: glycerophosphodiester phosphodiesterase [Planctomycetes bacterium]|nr:glycerophosphodiester phosphodiesterase [Planctomycetota bacterium]